MGVPGGSSPLANGPTGNVRWLPRALDAPELHVTVVVPTLNEAENLPFVLPRIPSEYEVVVVDGRSSDATVAVAQNVRADVLIVDEPRAGKGAALRAGIAAATGEIVVLIDADGSTDPAEIPRFVQALVYGADYAKGSRFVRGGGAGSADMTHLRHIGNAFFVRLVRVLFGGGYTDLCYGYNAFWRRHATVLALDADGFEIEAMMNIRALKAGLRVVEVPSFEHARLAGSSKLRPFSDGLRVLRTIFSERLNLREIRPGTEAGASLEFGASLKSDDRSPLSV
jgi:glycosyltransferase involved in cell wall biosynthesis